MIFAGIGARETPKHILLEMIAIGKWIHFGGIHWIRSGHAPGADQAFEEGAQERCVAYVPWSGFEKTFQSKAILRNPLFTLKLEELARKYHPTYDRLSLGAKKLMMRNGCQVLGEELNSPVKAVICWTKDGKDVGGTSQAIRIARAHDIPILNMALAEYNSAQKVIAVLENMATNL